MTYTGSIAVAWAWPLRSLPEILKISQTFMLQTKQILTNQRPNQRPNQRHNQRQVTNPHKRTTITRMPIPDSILKEDLEAFLNREISSKELAKRTGYHEVSLRRAIKRPPKPPQPKNKSALIATRKAFRATLAHLPVAEIQRLAHVSLSTANRIKKANGIRGDSK